MTSSKRVEARRGTSRVNAASRRRAQLRERPVEARANLPEVIAADLRQLITLGTFQPGLQLRQVELAARFGSSRVALREAFKLLAAEGVIEHDPNRGFFVALLSRHEAKQLYKIRRLLERELLRSVAWPSPDELVVLEGLVEALERALAEQDTGAWLDRHRQFFQTLFGLSPENLLVREVLRLIGLTDRYRALAPQVLPSAERHVIQERHLLTALAKRDRRRLLALFERDRKSIEDGVEKALRERGL